MKLMKKLAVVVTSFALVAFLGLELTALPAFAAKKKVPCEQVMSELNSGKKAAEVAKDLGTTVGHVRYCKSKAKKAEKAAKAEAPAAAPAPSGGEAPPAAPPTSK